MNNHKCDNIMQAVSLYACEMPVIIFVWSECTYNSHNY